MTRGPAASRPVMPAGYGIRGADAGLLPWSRLDEQMARARNYWIGTTRPDGRPHAMPVWGVWVDGAFCFATDRGSRKARNLTANPAVVIHLESGDDVVILEGAAAELTDPSRLGAVDDAYAGKYGLRRAEFPGDPVIWAVSPRVAFAWQEQDFPGSATCWLLGEGR